MSAGPWVTTWPLPCEQFLKGSGPPGPLEAAAGVLERCAATDDPATNERRKAAAGELRGLAEGARVCMGELEALGVRFDFDRGHAVAVSGGRGRPAKLLNLVVAGMFDAIGPAEWYVEATYETIRGHLQRLLPPDDLPTDARIRRAIERYGGRQ